MLASRLMSGVLDFCYPGVCAHCDSTCAGSSFLCDACHLQLNELAGASACPKCAMPVVGENAPCPYCQGGGRTPIDQIIRLGVFDDPLKSLIHQMKYNRRWTLAELLADRLFREERTRMLITPDTVLVAVPLHYRRQLARGYNQSELIARRLKWRFKCELAHPARRVRDTVTQTHIHNRAERETNVRGAFAMKRPGQIEDRHVVIVDDVTTTGATLRAFARTLKEAKPASVSAIVLAIADPKGRDFQAI